MTGYSLALAKCVKLSKLALESKVREGDGAKTSGRRRLGIERFDSVGL